MRWVPAVLAGVLATLLWTDAGHARGLDWHQVDTGAHVMVSDGRAVAWERADGKIAVRRIGHAPVLTKPDVCPAELRAVGDHYLLLECQRVNLYTLREAVVNIDTSAVREVEVNVGYADGPPYFYAVGDNWIAGRGGSYHAGDVTEYVNWRVGQRTNASWETFGPRHYLDLSAPALGARLCPPLRRTPYPDSVEAEPRWLPLQVDEGWAIERTADPHQPDILRRCGSSKESTSVRKYATLGGGFVAALTPQSTLQSPRFIARRLRDGRVFRGSLPGSGLMHAGPTLFSSAVTFSPSGKREGLRIFRARLPAR